VYDPMTQFRPGHSWMVDGELSAMLSVNIGDE
jgi:hypothetical protein